MQLLQDTFIIENLTVLTEGSSSDKMRIKGVFGRCNEKNNNGRVYPTAVLEGQLKKVQPMISERRLCGELDHPSNDTVKLSNASHLITKLEMKGNELIGEAELLNTPAGLTAQALVKGGVKIGISSRGMGTLSEDSDGNKIVNEDFRLVTFDLVADPSTRGAFPGLTESTESKFVRESVDKLEKERNFLTMLESSMRDAYSPIIEEAKKKKAAKKKKLTPRQAAVMDRDKDGDIEADDLADLRSTTESVIGAVRAEGSWHQIAYAIAEMCGIKHAGKKKGKKKLAEGVADVMDKERERGTGVLRSAGAAGLAGRSVAADKKRQARADVAADRIRAVGAEKTKGKVARTRVRQGQQTKRTIQRQAVRTALQKKVIKKGPEAVKNAAGKAADVVKKAPGAIKNAAERTTQAAEKFGERLGKAKVRGMQQQAARRKMGREDKAKRDARLAAASKKKPEPQAKKPGISDEEKYQRKALGQAAQKKATADVAARAKKQSEGEFGQGVSRSDKADMQKAIARRERKTGKKVNLTKKQALDLSHTIYRQMGRTIAEALGLVEQQDLASMSPLQRAERMKKMTRDSQRGKQSKLDKRRGFH